MSMKQSSLAETGYERRPKATKRQRFLSQMDTVIPWSRLLAVVDAAQPKMTVRGGRPSFPAETMLRIHFMPCSSGSPCPIPAWKKRCTTFRRCAPSPGWMPEKT
jgi:hypothetical protein